MLTLGINGHLQGLDPVPNCIGPYPTPVQTPPPAYMFKLVHSVGNQVVGMLYIIIVTVISPTASIHLVPLKRVI